MIQVRDLGKLYRIRSTERKPYSTFREDLVGGSKESQWEDFWAVLFGELLVYCCLVY